MKEDSPEGYYNCDYCRDRFFTDADGTLVNVRDRGNRRNRRDIEPEEWQNFEEGWRPKDWYDE